MWVPQLYLIHMSVYDRLLVQPYTQNKKNSECISMEYSTNSLQEENIFLKIELKKKVYYYLKNYYYIFKSITLAV